MGPLGLPELIFILVLALLIFGPRRLPEVGRTVGKALGEFRRATSELTRTLNSEVALEEERPRRAASPTTTATVAAPVVSTPSPQPAAEAAGETTVEVETVSQAVSEAAEDDSEPASKSESTPAAPSSDEQTSTTD